MNTGVLHVIFIYMYIYIYAYIYVRRNIFTPTYKHMYIRTYIHIYVYTQTHICTHISHTHPQSLSRLRSPPFPHVHPEALAEKTRAVANNGTNASCGSMTCVCVCCGVHLCLSLVCVRVRVSMCIQYFWHLQKESGQRERERRHRGGEAGKRALPSHLSLSGLSMVFYVERKRGARRERARPAFAEYGACQSRTSRARGPARPALRFVKMHVSHTIHRQRNWWTGWSWELDSCDLGVFRSHCFLLTLLRLIFHQPSQFKKSQAAQGAVSWSDFLAGMSGKVCVPKFTHHLLFAVWYPCFRRPLRRSYRTCRWCHCVSGELIVLWRFVSVRRRLLTNWLVEQYWICIAAGKAHNQNHRHSALTRAGAAKAKAQYHSWTHACFGLDKLHAVVTAHFWWI